MLPKAIVTVNALSPPPDPIVPTGDPSHISNDPVGYRRRLAGFRDIAAKVKMPMVHYMPDEHDTSLNSSEAYIEFFDRTHYTFGHKGMYLIATDNVSNPPARVGDTQPAWLTVDVRSAPEHTPTVMFTYQPLFDLYPQWD